MGRHAVPIELRFWAKVEKDANESGCWLWKGTKGGTGQGVIAYSVLEGGKLVQAARYSYELAYGHIPEGMDVVPACEVKLCVRPDHLAVAKHREVLLGRGSHVAFQQAAKTHCPRGHLYDRLNTYLYRGGRSCRTCRGMKPARA